MSFENARKNLQKYISDNFTGVASNQIAWDNVEFKPTIGTAWLRVSIQNTISDFVGLSGPSVRTRRRGLIFFQIFTPEGTGTLLADQIADDLANNFEALSLYTGEILSAVTKNEIGVSKSWNQTNVSLPFYYDELVVKRTTVVPN